MLPERARRNPDTAWIRPGPSGQSTVRTYVGAGRSATAGSLSRAVTGGRYCLDRDSGLPALRPRPRRADPRRAGGGASDLRRARRGRRGVRRRRHLHAPERLALRGLGGGLRDRVPAARLGVRPTHREGRHPPGDAADPDARGRDRRRGRARVPLRRAAEPAARGQLLSGPAPRQSHRRAEPPYALIGAVSLFLPTATGGGTVTMRPCGDRSLTFGTLRCTSTSLG